MDGNNGALRAIAYALLTLFFVMGVMKTCGSFAELRRPEAAFKVFVRFACANAAICLGGCIIVLACVIFSKFASTSPVTIDETLAPATMVWNYTGQLLFNMLVLVSTVKMSSQFIRELMGL